MELRSAGNNRTFRQTFLAMKSKLTSIRVAGHFFGVAVDFDGHPTHSHGPHTTRRAAREAIRAIMEDDLGHDIVKRIRRGTAIRCLSNLLTEVRR